MFSLIKPALAGALLLLAFSSCKPHQVSVDYDAEDRADSICFANLVGSKWIQTYDSEWPTTGGDTLRLSLDSSSAIFTSKRSSYTCDCVYHQNEGIAYLYFPCDPKERIKYVIKSCCDEELVAEVWVCHEEPGKGKFRKVGVSRFKKIT